MNKLIAEQSETYRQDLAALARIVSFARQSAQDLNVSFPAYFLDMALTSILDELKIAGVDVAALPSAADLGQIKGYH